MDTVSPEVSNRCLATIASTKLGTGQDRDGAEGRGARAGKRVGHGAAVGPSGGENLGRVYTETV